MNDCLRDLFQIGLIEDSLKRLAGADLCQLVNCEINERRIKTRIPFYKEGVPGTRASLSRILLSLRRVTMKGSSK